MRRAADVRKKIAPDDMEKCPQKSPGFDKGTVIYGFVADICGHTPTSAMIYANVRGSLHMSAAYARPVADIESTGAETWEIWELFPKVITKCNKHTCVYIHLFISCAALIVYE